MNSIVLLRMLLTHDRLKAWLCDWVAGLRVLVALTKVDEYDPSVAASLPRVFSSAPIRSLISQVGLLLAVLLHA
jgi:hypothetical protein